MIGCEKLCDKCDACEPFVWVLDGVQSRGESEGRAFLASADTSSVTRDMTETTALRAILDPASLAELLARALVGRGVDGIDVWPWFDSIMWRLPETKTSVPPIYALALPEARAALHSVIELPLDCGPDAALAALG